MTRKVTSDLWWKNAVIYCLDVETFLDSDGNGRGDFQGLSQRVDYLADLGVSHAYLSPVLQAAPGSTHGYDVLDHTRLSDEAGGREAFDTMIETRPRAAAISA